MIISNTAILIIVVGFIVIHCVDNNNVSDIKLTIIDILKMSIFKKDKHHNDK